MAVAGGSSVCCAITCSDQGADSCGTNGLCEATGATCAAYPPGTGCSTATCQTSSVVGAGACNSSRSCVPGPTAACPSGTTCSGGACSPHSAITLSTGSFDTCVVLVGGTVACFSPDTGTATAVPGVPAATAVSVSVGSTVACALLTTGQVACWTAGAGPASAATIVPGIAAATQLSVGWDHACVTLADGTAVCWDVGVSAPTPVAGLSHVLAVAAGSGFTCALESGGTVDCWGGPPASAATPTAVGGITEATALAAGESYACAIVAGGEVACWGTNTTGALGVNGSTMSTTPIYVAAVDGEGLLTGARALSASSFYACATTTSGTMACWGDSPVCYEYNEGSDECGTVLLELFGQDMAVTWTVPAAADDTTCVLDSNGSVWCQSSDESQMFPVEASL